MHSPFILHSGDKVGIISTARYMHRGDLMYADGILKQWGLIPVYGKTIDAQSDQFAGDDNLRADDLQTFLDDESIRAVICARGGYGTIRIIDKIDFTKFSRHPKWVCGFSDITILHMHLNDKLGIPAIHSCMPLTYEKNTQEALDSLNHILFGITVSYTIQNHELNQIGDAEGIVTGGNLSILYSLLGTKYGFSTAGKILFIEDVDEYLYHLDRMFYSFKHAGKLSQINGLIVGGMTDMKDNKIPFGKTAEQIIAHHTKDLKIPVCFNFPAGHIDDNRALILGKKIKLEINPTQTSIQYV